MLTAMISLDNRKLPLTPIYISALILDCTPRWGLGPSSWLSGRKNNSQLPWPQLFFVTTFISSFSPLDSRLHTTMGIGPLVVVVRQKDREFLGTPPSSFRSPLHLSASSTTTFPWLGPLDCVPSVRTAEKIRPH